MNKKQKSLTNKGFSLVELIIVIAIMAVLIGVLAPQYLKYVEQSRLQKDNQAIAEIANAVKIAMADESINATVTASKDINVKAGTHDYEFDAASTDALIKELSTVVGTKVTLGSNSYSTTAPTITVTKDATTGVVTVKATNFKDKVGTAVVEKNF
ncbi:MAG: prepilin-type N-terminal cleavage/methylation domain-containing protein [Lachnospiraceae bacterium]|nr:prepilin-type N-terminal cleavage/methylation domain-containing protein [Lachnospiraceae bacterium]